MAPNNAPTIDVVTANGGHLSGSGPVAQRLMQNGFNINALRTQATLRKDEWIQYDTAVVEVARRRLVGVADMMAAGLVYNLPNALGTTKLEWETISDMDPAILSMSGLSQSQNDRVNFELESMPIPIIHKDFNLNIRTVMASRTTGQPLDTTQAQLSARIVSEGIETLLFDGSTTLGSNNALYGLTTAPNRNTGSLSAAWNTATGAQIVTNTLSMIAALVADNMYGPYMLYISAASYVHFGDDYKADSDKTIMERVSEIPGISGIRPSKDLADNEAVLVQLSADVVDIVDGIQPTTVEWEGQGGFIMYFKVMAIMLPRVRNTQLLQSGIAHFSV